MDNFYPCHPVDKPALLHGSEELEELEESKKRVIVRKERKKERKKKCLKRIGSCVIKKI
ncbi:MAG TPA: hypothetical protein LFW21_01710 [Rickettsia endosymbiont of Pyrocoelia pectoralis]|nr:hypothetical protein [Rickettsia endosymbiont of Pyrocoelia pectoralis]